MPSEMYNPAHPGLVLRDYLEGHNVTHVAKHIGVSRVTLSKILNGHTGITADMSLRLSAALGTNPSFWLDMQSNYDMWQARKKKRPRIHPLKIAA
ncbi:MAG: HigA family addiction module antitoxin [Terracidiphilus sp.]